MPHGLQIEFAQSIVNSRLHVNEPDGTTRTSGKRDQTGQHGKGKKAHSPDAERDRYTAIPKLRVAMYFKVGNYPSI